MRSRLIAFTSSTSTLDRSMLEGTKSSPSGWLCMYPPVLYGRSLMIQCIAVDKVFCNSSGFSTPRYFVASACESASISSTCLPCRASATLRDTAVVVFPTPPFWFEIAMVFISVPPSRLFRFLHPQRCRHIL